jgi:hypothetical protein
LSARVYGRLTFLTTWPAVGLLVVLFMLCVAGFDWRAGELGRNNQLLDARWWYTPGEARDLLNALGERGRSLYSTTEVTLDLLFPAVYGGLFAALIGNLYRDRATARLLALVPACGALADWCENGLVAYLAWSFDGREDPVAVVAAAATLTKRVLFILAVVAVAGGAVRSIGGVSGTRAGMLPDHKTEAHP